MFPKKSCVVTLLYMIIYEKHITFSICIWGNAWIFGIEKEKYLWIHLIVDFMDLWYCLEILKIFCLKLYYLGNWWKYFWQEMVLKTLKRLWEYCEYLVIEISYETTWK